MYGRGVRCRLRGVDGRRSGVGRAPDMGNSEGMSDSDEAYPRPLSDPESKGLPGTADDDSNAYDEVLTPRAADGVDPAPLPQDREDGPEGLEEYGTGGDGGLRG